MIANATEEHIPHLLSMQQRQGQQQRSQRHRNKADAGAITSATQPPLSVNRGSAVRNSAASRRSR